MDSFEATTQFSQMLRNITPVMQNLTRAAHFAIKNHEQEDYLFHSIIEVLDDPNTELNTKSTIFQFIEVLMHEAFQVSQQPKSHYSYPYIHNLKSSLPNILLKVLPGANNSSLHNVYNSLKNISKTCKTAYEEYDNKYNSINTLLTEAELENVDANIPYPDIKIEDEINSTDPVITTWDLLIKKKKQSQYERLRLLKHHKVIEGSVNEEDMFSFQPNKTTKDQGDASSNAALVFTKKQILMRMEDDRESHKRSKENLWVVNRPKDSNSLTEDEFLVYYWNKFGNVTEEEDKSFRDSLNDLNAMVAQSYKDKQF
ncbi:Piso0_002647 [Millerozyma farinosa CBS 7064]|uniref:Piso0_002647 protein n=1 Tax=Pichia sorbitophila (strain ATCC MYA-4447 / BCRC 22081 / CBS 7064 / NBRC 10061 / NRRL Y-12695) TaxID=559304 RepID=G8YFL3_PICSO|nr:Piso0_002647 [Millerozyma farinosa CBS 7064]